MPRAPDLLALVLLSVLAAACPRPSGDASPPARAPDLTGTVTHVDRTGERTLRVRIEERPDEPSGSAKAVLQVLDDTRVLRGRALVSEREIRVGARVSAWITGPVMESYPVQARAEAIRIEGDTLPAAARTP